jgi:hypothetical protein
MSRHPLTPERARRELRHLLRLRDKDDFRTRLWELRRGAAGFGLGMLASVKAVAMPLAWKFGLAALVGLFFAFPLGLLVVVSLVGVVIGLALLTDGACADCFCCDSRNSCDLRNKRRRKLDAMIAERERLLYGPPVEKR